MEKIAVFDLFAGPGGLGEGFSAYVNKDQLNPFQIVLSVEKDESAHKTLTTRALFRKIRNDPTKRALYNKYVSKAISREELFKLCQSEARDANLETMLGPKTLGIDNAEIHKRIIELSDAHIGPKILIGGPPCQAYSLALFKSLLSRDLLIDALTSREVFLKIITSNEISNAYESTDVQPRLV